MPVLVLHWPSVCHARADLIFTGALFVACSIFAIVLLWRFHWTSLRIKCEEKLRNLSAVMTYSRASDQFCQCFFHSGTDIMCCLCVLLFTRKFYGLYSKPMSTLITLRTCAVASGFSHSARLGVVISAVSIFFPGHLARGQNGQRSMQSCEQKAPYWQLVLQLGQTLIAVWNARNFRPNCNTARKALSWNNWCMVSWMLSRFTSLGSDTTPIF